MALIIGTKLQHVQQPRHHPPIVIAIGGTHPQIHPIVILDLRLFLDNGLALLPTHHRINAFANRLVRVIEGRLRDSAKQTWFIVHPLFGFLHHLFTNPLLPARLMTRTLLFCGSSGERSAA